MPSLFLRTLLVTLFFIAELAHALPDLEFEYLAGKEDSSSTLSLDSDFPHQPDQIESFNWNVLGGTSKTQSTAAPNGSTTGPTITDTTVSFAGGLGYKSESYLTVDGTLVYDNTPDESLVDHGANFALGKTWRFAGRKKDDFETRLNFKWTVGSLDYVETFGAVRRPRRTGVALPTNGANTITQHTLGASTYLKPVEWFRVKLDLKGYSYSKDVNSFLQYLDSQNRRAVGLSNAVSGFSKNDLRLEVDFYDGPWELDLSDEWTRVAADNSLTTTSKVVLYRDFGEQWRVGIGGETIVSSSTANPTAENEVYLSVAYEF